VERSREQRRDRAVREAEEGQGRGQGDERRQWLKQTLQMRDGNL